MNQYIAYRLLVDVGKSQVILVSQVLNKQSSPPEK